MTIYTVKLGPGALHALNLGEHLLSRGYGGSENIRIRIQLAALDEPSDAVHVANANEPGVYGLSSSPIHESECVTDRGAGLDPLGVLVGGEWSAEQRERVRSSANGPQTINRIRPELRAVPLDEARAALGGIMGGECLTPMGEALQAAEYAQGTRTAGAMNSPPKDGGPTPAGVLLQRADELHKIGSDLRYQADAAQRTAKQYREAAELLWPRAHHSEWSEKG